MGRKEHPFVWYYNKELHFAELMNGWLFHGRELLSSDDISSADRRILKRNRRHRYRELYRDLYKNINGTAFCKPAQERHADISPCGNTSDPACERAGCLVCGDAAGTACGGTAGSACKRAGGTVCGGTAGSACKHADGTVCGGAAGSACERANDSAHRCGGEITFRLLTGVEHHDHVHYAMPVRVMDYDCASMSFWTLSRCLRNYGNM